jgi:hypothetical protein
MNFKKGNIVVIPVPFTDNQTTKRTSRRVSDSPKSHANNGRYIHVNGTAEKVYTVDEVFSHIEKNLNDFYGTSVQHAIQKSVSSAPF